MPRTPQELIPHHEPAPIYPLVVRIHDVVPVHEGDITSYVVYINHHTTQSRASLIFVGEDNLPPEVIKWLEDHPEVR
ncbi:MAG: hypothetical protein ACXQS4_02515 [Methermicoccaceae archaeon]